MISRRRINLTSIGRATVSARNFVAALTVRPDGVFIDREYQRPQVAPVCDGGHPHLPTLSQVATKDSGRTAFDEVFDFV